MTLIRNRIHIKVVILFLSASQYWISLILNLVMLVDPDTGKDWRQEERGMTEDKMVGWHLNGHEFQQPAGDGEGQGSLACCSPWGCKELVMTEWLNNNKCWWTGWRYNVNRSKEGETGRSECAVTQTRYSRSWDIDKAWNLNWKSRFPKEVWPCGRFNPQFSAQEISSEDFVVFFFFFETQVRSI